MRISVLDFDHTLTRAAEIAPVAESLGYFRYWFGEHPPQANAELLIAMIAGMTSTMRIGAGGVVLRLRSTLQSAANFLFLTATFGDRIDAGCCAGWANSKVVADALKSTQPDSYENKVREWIGMLQNSLDEDAFGKTRRLLGQAPEIWSLGSGTNSAHLAAALGVRYAYSLFNKQSTDDTSPMMAYRALFRPSASLDAPRAMLAISGLCAETDVIASSLASVPPRWDISDVSTQFSVIGSASTCRTKLRELKARYQMDELLLLELSPTVDETIGSLTRFAEIAGEL